MGLTVVYSLIEELTKRSQEVGNGEDEQILCGKLLGISAKEKLVLEKLFYGHQWDLGSAAVVRLLVSVDLFSLSIYLLKLQTPQEQQIVFNDLLETEYTLLASLIKSSLVGSSCSLKLKNIIVDGVNNLLEDLLNSDSNSVSVPNYLAELGSLLDVREMNYFLDIHFNSLLDMDACEAKEAFERQFSWQSEESQQSLNKSLKDVISSICSDPEALLSRLITTMICPGFTSWKYALFLVHWIVLQRPILRSSIKKTLSELFNQWITKRSEFSCLVMMLLGRQLAYSSGGAEKASTYQQWYKFQISEINYLFKSKADFQYGLTTLSSLVPLENDADFLRIHAQINISAPPYCKQFVTDFRDSSRKRELVVSEKVPGVVLVDNVEVIEID